MKYWISAEEELLKKLLSDNTTSITDIQKKLKRSDSSIAHKAYKLGLRDEYLTKKNALAPADTEQQTIVNVKEIVEKVVKQIPERHRLEVKIPKRGKLVPETWVNIFSDLHYGLVVRPLEVGELGEYNTSVARERVEYLLEVIARILEYFPNRPDTLVIPFLGDMIDNTIMRNNQRANTELNLTEQVMYVTEILVDYITALTKYFPKIKCYGVYGNHGRITRSINDSAPSENFDKIVYWAVKQRISNFKNVSFDFTDAQHMVVNINGWKFWLEHGDSVHSWNGIPFYGAKRERANIGEMMSIFNEHADYVLMGHHHSTSHFNNIFINGAFVGGDLYSIGKLRRMSLPYQTLLGVNKKHGIVWERDVCLIDNPKNLKLKIYN